MRSRKRLLLPLLVLGFGLAARADETAFDALAKQYDQLSRNHDDHVARKRREVIYRLFDHLELKPARRLLREIYDDERYTDNRIAAVEVLARSGRSDDLDWLLSKFKKERTRGPVLALGSAVGHPPGEDVPFVAKDVASRLSKARDDVLVSLLEGLGTLGDEAAWPALSALDPARLPERARFERLVAIGACGGERALDELAAACAGSSADLRLGAVLGLVRTGSDAALPHLVGALSDPDPRVVEAAARHLGERRHEPAKAELAAALPPASIRAREAIRGALVAITGVDHGHDAEAWRAVAEGKQPERPGAKPEFPRAFGMAIPSDRVLVLLDTSRSMDDMGRFERAREGLASYVESLPGDWWFDAYAVRTEPEAFGSGWATGEDRPAAAAWLREQLTGGRYDLKRALAAVVRERPGVDTIVLATDSDPMGDRNEDTPLEVMEIFRRANRVDRVRLFVAFVAPGGRNETSELYPELYEDRKRMLERMAKESGGEFVAVE